jgi:hypothetical protein
MTLAIWLLFYLGVGLLVGRLYNSFLGWGAVRVLFYPGMLVAALGRVLACVLTGRKTKEVDTVRRNGPVGANAPEGSMGFRALFALAPFIMSLVTFLIIDALLDHPVSFRGRLPSVALQPEVGRTFVDVAIDYVQGIAHAFGSHELGDVKAWLYLYSTFALVVGTAPSTDDAKSVGVAALSLGLFFTILEALHVRLEASLPSSVWVAFSTLVGFSIFVVVASAVLFLPVKFLRDARKDEK